MTPRRRPKRHPGGRPPLPPGEARTERIQVTATPAERARYAAAAARDGLHLAVWIRAALDVHARE